MSSARRKRLGIALPFVGLILWFAYLWFVSGVVPMVEKYDDGKPRVLGYMKREGLSTYRKTGHWVTYYPDGAKASEGDYLRGEKVDGSWTYWDFTFFFGRHIYFPTQATGRENLD